MIYTLSRTLVAPLAPLAAFLSFICLRSQSFSLQVTRHIRVLSASSHSFNILHSLPTHPEQSSNASPGTVLPKRFYPDRLKCLSFSHAARLGRLTSNPVVDLPLPTATTAISRDQEISDGLKEQPQLGPERKQRISNESKQPVVRDTSWRGGV